MRDFFKKIGINQSSFFAFLFYGLAAYFILDRFFEVFYLLTTNGPVVYRNPINPIVYSFIVILPMLGFAFLCSSPVIKLASKKVPYYTYSLIAFLILLGTMTTQFINQFVWWLLKLDMDKFDRLFASYSEYFNMGFKALIYVVPFVAILNIIEYIQGEIYGDDEYIEGIVSYTGIDTAASSNETGPYTCEIMICRDSETSLPVVVPEKKRFEQTLIQGATGTGKTSTLMLPMSAMDLERKYFFREYSKKIAYTLLRKGIAYIEGPVSNEYLNENFLLNYVIPKKGFEDEFKRSLRNMILNEVDGKFFFKGLGITIVENDGKYISDFKAVAENFGIKVLSVDPTDENSLGINPFVISDPAKVASIISDVLRSMYESEGNNGEQFFTDVTVAAFQNISILLKLMYPKLNNGDLPTLEDILVILQNFDKVEELVEEMKKDNELEREYKLLIAYFEKNFYKPPINIQGFALPTSVGSGRRDTERFLYGAVTQLDNLLKNPGVRRALCRRNGNIDFDKALSEGHVITACSKRELGIMQSKAFGMFFILQFQDAVLRRPGSEDTRIPHFLYIDEFPEYINKETGVMFTLFRKYRCAVTVSIQNLSQLEKVSKYKYYRQEVLANTKTQIVFGDTNPEDSAYWQDSFGKELKLDSNPDKSYKPDEAGQIVATGQSVKMADKEIIKSHRLSVLPFKTIMYKSKNLSGKTIRGKGKTDFLSIKYREPHTTVKYNFERFMVSKPTTSTVATETFFEDEDDNIFTTTYTSTFDANIKDTTYNEDARISNIVPESTTGVDIDKNIDISNDPIIESGEYSNSEIAKDKKNDEIIIGNDFDDILIDIMEDSVIKESGSKPKGRKKKSE